MTVIDDQGRPEPPIGADEQGTLLGFLDYQATDDSFFDLFARLRDERVIP